MLRFLSPQQGLLGNSNTVSVELNVVKATTNVFLRENLHKIHNADLLVLKAISDVPEMGTMCGLAALFFFHSLS